MTRRKKTAAVPAEVLEAIRSTDGDWYALTMYSAKPEEGEDLDRPTRCRIEVYSPDGRWWAPCNMDNRPGPVDWSTLVMNLPKDVEDIVGKTTSVMRAYWRVLAITCIDAMYREKIELHDDLYQALRHQARNLFAIVEVAETADPLAHKRAHAWFLICRWLISLLQLETP